MKSTEWTPDSGLSAEVSDLFARAIESYRVNPNYIPEHANHEESIRVGGYSKRTLMELVQNAADAMKDADPHANGAGRVEIVLDLVRKTLYCANAGRPFSLNGLTSMTHAHISSKRGDEIGRFGLGFKSVLAVTDTPQVFSRSISFEFNSPKANAAFAEIAPDARRHPVLRTPTQLDATTEFTADPVLAELSNWATTIVKLPRAQRLDSLKKEIEAFRSEFLLFVTSVREVRLRIIGPDEDLATRHISRNLGSGRFQIERPNGDSGEWYVETRDHEPGAVARAEVGDAVSRNKVAITIAVPARWSQFKIGEFWSYFPLLDKTSASAIFNAPWSVNDDRTTLLKNTYNREILIEFADMFVEMMPKIVSSDDPAAHLEYLPARGREAQFYGDEILCAHVPQIASTVPLIPDANAVLRKPEELRPLEFTVSGPTEKNHQDWILSPNTGDDVPHWRCYSTPTRLARLRQLYVHKYSAAGLDRATRDEKAALEAMPKRGILSWLREWADGTHMRSAMQALVFVLANPKIDGINSAKVLPTTDGLRALKDSGEVFLRKVDDIDEGACFVLPEFLSITGVERNLRDRGLRDLDPLSILEARLESLSTQSDDEALSRFWDAVDGVPIAIASKSVAEDRTGRVRVPTLDGGWAPPSQVFDIDGIGDDMPDRMLDRQRCMPGVAHAAGVVHEPVLKYSTEDEIHFEDYRQFALSDINRRLGPGEHRVERIEFDLSEGAGPFSMLLMLEKAEASAAVRVRWTADLLRLDSKEYWTCEDLDTQLSYRVVTPIRWAVTEAGLLNSSHGHRAPGMVVSASLLEFDGLLPLFHGPSSVEDKLALPRELNEVPVEVLREALETTPTSTRISPETLTKFVLAAGRKAYPDQRPPRIPAFVGRGIEITRSDSVYLAIDEEQRKFLADRHKPYLRADAPQVQALMDSIGCRRFEDSFEFSLMREGEQEPERVIDLYIGLRKTFAFDKVVNASIVKAARIAKRVTTEDGTEDQPLEWHLDGLTLLVHAELDERRTLEILNQAFELRLSNHDLNIVEQAGIDHQLELLRQDSLAASDDAERLEVFFGEDTLKEALPKGLWAALQHQNLVKADTSVAALYLTVNGSDSIRLLAKRFEEVGFDIPTEWAGRNPTIAWLRKMGFGAEYAGQRNAPQEHEFVVPGAVRLNPLHDFQQRIRRELRDVFLSRDADGRHKKCMVELPTGAGKTRVASETVLRLFAADDMSGTVLWIAQSAELCEQAVQTFDTVWRGLADERPLTIGRLWDRNDVHQPRTEFSVIVATDAKLQSVLDSPEYEWLRDAAAVFIDEGHRAGDSKRYTAILRWLGVDGRSWERPLVGLSATPFKGRFGDGEATKDLAARFGNRRLTAFEGNAYEELVARGVLARVKRTVLNGVDVELDAAELEKVRSLHKLEQGVLDRIGADQARMKILVDHIMQQDPTWPILVFTPSVLSAQVLAATLRYRDVEARAVSGDTGLKERRDTIEGFKRGQIRVLANCNLLVQGFDAPGVRALYIARPTFSPSAYIQMAGRGLRGPENGGNPECLIVDVADNFGAMNDFLGFRAYEALWEAQAS